MTDAATATVRATAGDRTAVAAVLTRIDETHADTTLPHAARTTLTQMADLLRRLPERPAAPVPVPQDVDAALAELRGLPTGARTGPPGRPPCRGARARRPDGRPASSGPSTGCSISPTPPSPRHRSGRGPATAARCRA